MTDAVVLASCGEAIVPYLKYQPWLKATERAACVRTLGLIGDARANNLLKDYLNDPAFAVAQELVSFVDDWSQISVIKQHVEHNDDMPIKIPRKCLRDLRQLSTFTNITSLYLGETEVSDISVLANFTNLTRLILRRTKVSDISVLESLINLTNLELGGTEVSDISALENLINLTYLSLWGTRMQDISALSSLSNLAILDLRNTLVSDISTLAHLTNLAIYEIK